MERADLILMDPEDMQLLEVSRRELIDQMKKWNRVGISRANWFDAYDEVDCAVSDFVSSKEEVVSLQAHNTTEEIAEKYLLQLKKTGYVVNVDQQLTVATTFTDAIGRHVSNQLRSKNMTLATKILHIVESTPARIQLIIFERAMNRFMRTAKQMSCFPDVQEQVNRIKSAMERIEAASTSFPSTVDY